MYATYSISLTLHWKALLHYRGQLDLWLDAGLEVLLPEAMRQEKDENCERATRNLTSTKLTSYEQAPFTRLWTPSTQALNNI